jgi:hypothetical protein
MVGAASTVTVAVEVAGEPVVPVTVSVYVVVLAGLTVTATPLEAAMLPGVMTPVPLAKTAVKLELPPAVMLAALAAKLVMDAGGVCMFTLPPQPVMPARPKVRVVMAKIAKIGERFIGNSCGYEFARFF